MIKKMTVFSIVLIILRLVTLGYSPLIDPTEGRYSFIALGMLRDNQWVMPFLHDGNPFWSKPPLHFWIAALCFKIFGVNEFAARLPSFMACASMVAMTWFVARKVYSKQVAVMACFILMTSFPIYFLSGMAFLDPTLAAFFSCTMGFFILSVENTKQSRLFGALTGFFLGIGLLAKGPLILLLCGTCVFITIIIRRNAAVLKQVPWLAIIIGTIVFFVPWLILAERRTPGFLYYYFYNEHFLRYFSKNYGDRYGAMHPFPYGTIILFWLAAMLPWTPLVLAALTKKTKRISESLILSWALSCVIFYIPCRNIVFAYILPAMPAVAMLASCHYQSFSERVKRSFYWCAIILAAIAVGALVYGYYVIPLNRGALVTGLFILLLWVLIMAVFKKLHFYVAASLIPVMCIFYTLGITHDLGMKNSSKKLITDLMSRANSSSVQLIYFDTAPASAYFYASIPPRSLYKDLGRYFEVLASPKQYFVIFPKQFAKEMLERGGKKLLQIGVYQDEVVTMKIGTAE